MKNWERNIFSLNLDGDSIRGSVIKPREEKIVKGGLILCHGIPSGESPQGGGYDQLGRFFARRGFVTMFFNFRGTGESGGHFDLRNWVEDLQEIINHYFSRYGNAPLIVAGFSAGAAVSLEVVVNDGRVSALALAACPRNFSFFFEHFPVEAYWEWCYHMGFFRRQGALPEKKEWGRRFLSIRPEREIKRFSPRSLLLLHGEKDHLVPLNHAHNLYALAGREKRLVTFPRLGHRLRNSQRVIGYLQVWLEEIIGRNA